MPVEVVRDHPHKQEGCGKGGHKSWPDENLQEWVSDLFLFLCLDFNLNYGNEQQHLWQDLELVSLPIVGPLAVCSIIWFQTNTFTQTLAS